MCQNEFHYPYINPLSYLDIEHEHDKRVKTRVHLVTAHTDVGVIKLFPFDSGSFPMLKRSDGKVGWVDITLPNQIPPEDPIKLSNCFAELSRGKLPFTLHRAMVDQVDSAELLCSVCEERSRRTVGG